MSFLTSLPPQPTLAYIDLLSATPYLNMSLNLPLRTATNASTSTTSTASRRNQESRNYFTSYTPPSSTEAINGPVREPAREPPPISDRLIVGVDFGTTFSG